MENKDFKSMVWDGLGIAYGFIGTVGVWAEQLHFDHRDWLPILIRNNIGNFSIPFLLVVLGSMGLGLQKGLRIKGEENNIGWITFLASAAVAGLLNFGWEFCVQGTAPLSEKLADSGMGMFAIVCGLACGLWAHNRFWPALTKWYGLEE